VSRTTSSGPRLDDSSEADPMVLPVESTRVAVRVGGMAAGSLREAPQAAASTTAIGYAALIVIFLPTQASNHMRTATTSRNTANMRVRVGVLIS
jgi:hypothetical protein